MATYRWQPEDDIDQDIELKDTGATSTPGPNWFGLAASAVPLAIGAGFTWTAAQADFRRIMAGIGPVTNPLEQARVAAAAHATNYFGNTAITRKADRIRSKIKYLASSAGTLFEGTKLDAGKIKLAMGAALGKLPGMPGSEVGEILSSLPTSGTPQEILENMLTSHRTGPLLSNLSISKSFLKNLRTLGQADAVPERFLSVKDLIPGSIHKSEPWPLSNIRDNQLRKNIEAISRRLGARKPSLTLRTSEGIEGQLLQANFGGRKLDIPLTVRPGVVVTGVSQQSRYITGTIGVVGPDMKIVGQLTSEQYMTSRIAQELQALPPGKISFRDWNAIKKRITDETRTHMEYVGHSAQVGNTGAKFYEDFRSSRMHLVKGTFEGGISVLRPGDKLTPEEMLKLSEVNSEMGLYPGSARTIAGKKTSAMFTRNEMASLPFSEAVNWAQNPLGVIRPIQTNPKVAKFVANTGTTYAQWYRAELGKTYGSQAPAVFRMLALDPEQYATELQTAGQKIAEGEKLIRADLPSMGIEYSSVKLSNVNPELEALVRGGEGGATETEIQRAFGRLKPGDILGIDAKTRDYFRYEGGMRLEGITRHAEDKNLGAFLGIQFSQETGLEESMKIFGSGRGLIRRTDQGILSGIAGRVGASSGIEGVMTLADMKKHRNLLLLQQTNSLLEELMRAVVKPEYQKYVADPLSLARELDDLGRAGGKWNWHEATRKVFDIARASELSPGAMGKIFGALPHVYGMDIEQSQKMLMGATSDADILAMGRGFLA